LNLGLVRIRLLLEIRAHFLTFSNDVVWKLLSLRPKAGMCLTLESLVSDVVLNNLAARNYRVVRAGFNLLLEAQLVLWLLIVAPHHNVSGFS
jgi:hypothetical protein